MNHTTIQSKQLVSKCNSNSDIRLKNLLAGIPRTFYKVIVFPEIHTDENADKVA